MKTLSTDEACSILNTGSLPEFVRSLSSRLPHQLTTYSIPGDSGAKCSLSKLLRDLLLPAAPVFIYVGGWGVWPSAENFDLFDGYRRSLGEHRSINLAPVHMFDQSDGSSFVSIMSLALYFLWDASVFDERGTISVNFSHDEWIETKTACPDVANEWSKELESMELEPLRV